MKMTQVHYNHMLKEISEIYLPEWVDDMYKKGFSERRVAWDLLNAAALNPFVCSTLYNYLNDVHIDTALRKIMREVQ